MNSLSTSVRNLSVLWRHVHSATSTPIQRKEPKNGIELAFDTLLKGRDGITHRQKVMNKYLNIVDIPPVDGCDIITTIDVGMQDIAEKALVDELKEINATVGVAILMEVQTGRHQSYRQHDQMQ